MEYTERQKQIISMLKNGSMSISDIADMLYVSQMTIRRDISDLKKMGIITQFRGGIAINPETVIVPIDLRENSEKNDKILLAKKAVQYVRNGMLIFIDSSSTCFNIVPLLADFKDLQVITNSTKVLMELGKIGIRSKMVCGNHVPKDRCVVGSEAEAYIKNFRFDIAFISSSGFNDKRVTDWSEAQTNVRRAAIESSKKTFCLMLPSKYERNYQFVVCTSKDVEIITLG
ncbi:MAG: DeoR/GlpR transcriptional regulator [Clostridia bacterium]|nr:DeoR/GlpR transcriptional regulator [Clostridia bacterium]